MRYAARLVPDRVISLPDWVVADKVTPEVFELIVWIYDETHAD